jgi:membrane protein implicated in regulation of membrane protease activity
MSPLLELRRFEDRICPQLYVQPCGISARYAAAKYLEHFAEQLRFPLCDAASGIRLAPVSNPQWQQQTMVNWLSNLIASTTTTITFFTIFLVGVGFSAFSLIFGAHSDHGVDHDLGHDTGDAGHDAGSDHGGHDGSDHHGDSDAGMGGFFSVGMFSVRGIALLATGFGGIGFLVFTTTQRILFSTTAALVGGYIFAFAVLYTLKVFKSQQANSLVSVSRAVGTQGIVTTSIPEGGVGEVSVSVSGVEMFKPARSANQAAIKSGTRVEVNQVTGGTLVVSPSKTASTAARTGKS